MAERSGEEEGLLPLCAYEGLIETLHIWVAICFSCLEKTGLAAKDGS